MASKSICFWSSIIFISVHFGSSIKGNGLQQVEEGIDVSVMNTSTLYSNGSTNVHMEDALYSEGDGNRIENDSSNESGLIWEQPLSASILDASNDRKRHFAILRTEPGRYFSAKAAMSVHSAYNTSEHQQTIAAIWVMNGVDGPQKRSEMISAGWHVNPGLYINKGTNFFVSWAVVDGNSRKGCYNRQCKGFVVLQNQTIYPGNIITPLSIYNGVQVYITLTITKDSQTGDWWLYFRGPNGDQPVGYWPKTLFTSLADSATNVDFGGAVSFNGAEGPLMGSGVFPSEGERKAASLTALEINGTPLKSRDKIFYRYQSLPNWYQIDGDDQMMYFGGPGGK